MHRAQPSDISLLRDIGLPVLIVLAGYFIPTIIAFARGHVRRWSVLFLNVILGWTGFVWIYLILMAFEVV